MEELMRFAHVPLGVALLICLLATHASAADPGWRLRMFAAGVFPDTDETILNPEGEEIHVTAGSAFGGGAGLEYQFTRHLGGELGVVVGSPKVELGADIPGIGSISVSDAMTTVVVTADLLVHLTPASPTIDFYVGAGIARVSYGDLNYDVPVGEPETLDATVAADLTWSARAGIELAFGEDSGWAATAGVRYIPSELEAWQVGTPADATATFDFNMLNVTAGLVYRF
jgi:opacity protein-like surface antigen